MRTKVLILMMATFFLLPGTGLSQSHRIPEHAFLILMDTGGTNINVAEAFAAKMKLFTHLRTMKSDVRMAESYIEIISLNEGKPAWVGTPTTMEGKKGKKLKELVSVKPNRCSDLKRGFSALKTKIERLERRGFKKIHLIVVSPLIDTPPPCGDTKLKLPQYPPQDFDFAGALTGSDKVKTILFYWVHFQQAKIWGGSGVLKPLIEWDDSSSDHTYHLFEESETLQGFKTGLRGLLR